MSGTEATPEIVDAGAAEGPEVPPHVKMFEELTSQLAVALKALQVMKPLVKDLEKECKKMRNGSGKKKKRSNTGNSSASLQQLLAVSDELNTVLGNELGTKMKRPDITQAISNYTKEKGLKDSENKRVIVLNEELVKIIEKPPGETEAKAGDKIDLFKLLGYLKHHITKDGGASD